MAKKKKEIKVSKEVIERKKREINEVLKLIDESNSIVIASIKSLPTRQFQTIKKNLRGKADIKVLKKSVISRVLDEAKQSGISELKNYIKEDTAFIFSKLDPFELSGMLSESKSPVKAKAGQTAESDIEIEPGPTDLIPGPVISELGSLGIKISIEDGKINIREKKKIVKTGEKINEAVAGLMSKLDIRPFYVGLEPIVGYDKKSNKVYKDIKVDKTKTLEELKDKAGKALGFAVSVAYLCKETIRYILGRAASQEKALEKFIKTENLQSQQTSPEVQQNIQGGQ